MQTTVHEQVLEMTRRILKKDRFEMKSETSLIKEIAEEPIPVPQEIWC